jgi:hypothetical protein
MLAGSRWISIEWSQGSEPISGRNGRSQNPSVFHSVVSAIDWHAGCSLMRA